MSFGFRRSAEGRRQHHRRPRKGRFLRLESLETRIALAADCLGAISGTVALDVNDSGTIEPGEGVPGATVQLYRDTNGNNIFEPGSDTRVNTDVTDANGDYAFSGLATDNYFVVQIAQTTVGGVTLDEMVSPRKSIDGTGEPGQVIDPFDTATGPTIDSFPAGTPVEESFNAPDAIGGERELVAELTAGMTDDIVSIRTVTGRLLVNPDFGAIGRYAVIWDGDGDAPGGGVDPTGLGGVDLTEVNGVTGLGQGFALEDVAFDQAGATIRLRVYTDAGSSSQAVLTDIPALVTNNFFVNFDDFNTLSGNGADFTNVGAIEMEIQASLIAMDGELSILRVVGLDSIDCDFINAAPIPSIDIEKLTNGFQADLPTDADVPIINLNTTSAVTWTYVVTNTGQSPLDSVQVEDNRIGTISSANITSRSINGDDILDVGEVWTYTVTGTATVGSYTNTGTVTAISVGSDALVSDADNSNYRGIAPAISIEKATNGFDADTPDAPDVPRVPTGSTVTWTYVVTNTGTDPLTGVQVTDSVLGGISDIVNQGNGDGILDVGEAWTYRATGTAVAGDYQNLGSVVAVASDRSQVADSDFSHYEGVTAAIAVEKSTNGFDADAIGSGPAVIAGTLVTWNYVVTNRGDVPLSNVRVQDDAGTPNNPTDDFFATFIGGDTNNNNLLEAPEAWRYQANGVATVGAYQNTAVATANSSAGTQVSDSDPSSYTGIAAPAQISKRRFLASYFR